MQDAAMSPLAAWQSFYVIVGSAAATLTGLMFVVITLIAGTQARRSSGSIAAYGTPTVVHFCAALFTSALFAAPWQGLWQVGVLLSIAGLGGVAYVGVVLRRALSQDDYEPVLEDWLWHTIFPFLSYTVLIVAAIVLQSNPIPALFGIGAVTVLLVFIGIHNSWDTVTYITTISYQPENRSQE